MDIQKGRTRIALNPMSGAVLRIEDTVTGLLHMDARRGGRGDQRLFRVVAPSDAWWSCHADSQDQEAVEPGRDGDAATVRFADLVAADGCRTGIGADVRVEPSDAADELLFTLRLVNRGARTVTEVIFPWLAAWHGYGGSGRDRFALGACRFLDPYAFPTPAGNIYARNHQRVGTSYPVELYAPWADISGPQGGLSYLNYMPTSQNGYFCIENLAGYGNDYRLAFGWAHTVALRPGETWTSPPIGVAVHGGDWHETADRYSAWLDAHHPPDYGRPRVRAGIGFQNVFFRGFDGTPFRDLETIPEVAATGRRYGVDMLCVWDALTLGNYARRDPHDLTDYPRDEREALRRGLEQAEAAGTRTCALINFRHPNVPLHLSDPALQRQIQRRYDGTARTENWSGAHDHGRLLVPWMGPESYVYSPFSSEHRDRVLRLTRDYLDLGYTSMFYDQPFEHHPDYGFMAQGHRPETTHDAALRLIAEVRDLLLGNDPQAVIIGEECDALATPSVDLWMSWSISQMSRRDEAAMMRYAIPHTMLSWVLSNELERAGLAFALGMYLCLMVHGAEGTLDDEPRLAEHVAALARLRGATAARTVMARFRDRRGLELDADEGLCAYAYESEAGPALIVAAPGASGRGALTVHRDAFGAPGDPDAGTLHRLDGSRERTTGDTLELALGENEVAVWVL